MTLFPPSSNPVSTALNWVQQGYNTVLAIVVQTWGSSPQPVGSFMVITEQMLIEGSVSGGCIETSVIADALDTLENDTPLLKHYGVSNELAWQTGLSCGGKIEILFVPVSGMLREMFINTFNIILSQQKQRIPTALAIKTKTPALYLLTSPDSGATPPEWINHYLTEQARKKIFRQSFLAYPIDSSSSHDGCSNNGWGKEEENCFFLSFPIPLQLVVVGAVHTTQILTEMARLCGIVCCVIDPRTVFATAERFPGSRIIPLWPKEGFVHLTIDSHTAIVTLTHDIKLDKPALEYALNSEAFYIGALGSQQTQQARRQLLSEQGFSPEQISRIHGPIGLKIGAIGSAEIAVSILAEIIASHRQAFPPYSFHHES